MAEEEVRKEARRKELTLEADFTLGPGQVVHQIFLFFLVPFPAYYLHEHGQEDVACVDLEDGWPEDAAIVRHVDYKQEHIAFVR